MLSILSPTHLNSVVYKYIDMNKKILGRFDQKYSSTDFREISDLFSGSSFEMERERVFMETEWDAGRVVKALILINSETRETKRYAGPFNFKEEEIKDEWLIDYYYNSAIAHLVKWGHIPIENELEGLLTEDQFFVWCLKVVYDLSYSDIAGLREHFGSSGNESTIRDIYMKARIKMKKLLTFCSKQSELVKRVVESD